MYELIKSLMGTKVYVYAGGLEFQGNVHFVSEHRITLIFELSQNIADIIDIDMDKVTAIKRKHEGDKIPNLRGWSFPK